jgi:YceI-like domain
LPLADCPHTNIAAFGLSQASLWASCEYPNRRGRRAGHHDGGMTPLRFSFDSVRSCVWVDARSNLHPINTETRGLRGWIEVTARPEGTLDLTMPVRGRLELSVDRLSSGNQLYDRELKRRIDARRYPLIEGEIISVTESDTAGSYLVAGDLTFHGTTRRFTDEMTITLPDDSTVELKGQNVFDIREFNMKPPSMLMLKVYPEVAVRVELYGNRED